MEELIHSNKPVPEVISMEETRDLWKEYDRPEDRTLFSLLYITGCRITEALNVRPEDLEKATLDIGEILKINLITLKNRRHKFRILPVPIDNKIEKELTECIYKYIQVRKIPDDKKILKLSRTNAWNRLSSKYVTTRATQNKQIIDNYSFKVRPHYLRHCRLTHLVQYYNFDETKLTRFAGWTNSAPAQVYIRLNWMDLARSMVNGQTVDLFK